jgi:hypothetical protein
MWENITNIKHMTNAKDEFLRITHIHRVLCATITNAGVTHNLKVGYSPEDYNKFLESINFEYDAGYGTMNLHGVIWMQDGTWYDRGEYDGSEWWEYRSAPIIPKELI